MDLDRFKFVNDFYGHLEGDVVLQRVAHILEQNCRRSDVVARYGGDEFVILMPETTIDQSRALASKLRGWVASDPLLRDKNVTGSFGIAAYPLHGSTPQELIQVADSFDVSLETPRRQRRQHHRRQSLRRNQKMEAGCSRSLSRRNSQTPIQHRPGSLRRNPPPHRSIHPLASRRKSERATRSIASLGSRNGNVASAWRWMPKINSPTATRKKFPPTPR